METLYIKFENAKNRYELSKKQETEKIQEIIENISFFEKIVLCDYASENLAISLFQRNVDFSKLTEKYNILYDEKDSKFYCVKKNLEFREVYGTPSKYVEVINMYVLLPKEELDKPLCLFVKRDAGKGVRFTSKLKSNTGFLKCSTDFFCENSVKLCVVEYDFDAEFSCDLQEKEVDKNVYQKVNIPKNEYLEFVKEHVKNNYFNKEYLFKSYSNSDFRKYFKHAGSYSFDFFDGIISSYFLNCYNRLKFVEDSFEETQEINEYKFQFSIKNIYQDEEVIIFDENKSAGRNFGKTEIKFKVMAVEVKIYKKGLLKDKLVKEKSFNLKDAVTFKEKLSDFLCGDFDVYI